MICATRYGVHLTARKMPDDVWAVTAWQSGADVSIGTAAFDAYAGRMHRWYAPDDRSITKPTLRSMMRALCDRAELNGKVQCDPRQVARRERKR